jgi:hypothetical protein
MNCANSLSAQLHAKSVARERRCHHATTSKSPSPTSSNAIQPRRHHSLAGAPTKSVAAARNAKLLCPRRIAFCSSAMVTHGKMISGSHGWRLEHGPATQRTSAWSINALPRLFGREPEDIMPTFNDEPVAGHAKGNIDNFGDKNRRERG